MIILCYPVLSLILIHIVPCLRYLNLGHINNYNNLTQFQMNTRNSQYKTILTDEPAPQGPNPNHPLFYYEQRSNFLSSLSDKYSSKFRLPTMDLRRNVRVDYYLSKYQQIKDKVDKQNKKHSCYLNSNQFNTVFADCIDQRRQRNRQKLEQQRLKKDLHNLYLAQIAAHQQPQHDSLPQKQRRKYNKQQNGQNGKQFNTILIDYETKQKQLYLLEYQINKLKFQDRIQRQVKNNRQICRDQQLLTKMSNNILSAYMVNFDQIYNKLIDEILTEEVYYLNYMEAQFAVERKQVNNNQVDQARLRYENAKTIQMMDLVKKLDDLCDQ